MTSEEDLVPQFKGFYDMLEDSVRDYDGEYQDIIKVIPDMFTLFTNLLEDPLVPIESKPIINATIAYFVAPFDALPEEVYGPVGYIDDLFLCAWSLKKLQEQVGDAILENNWENEKDLKTVIDDILEQTSETIRGLEDSILEYVGLK